MLQRNATGTGQSSRKQTLEHSATLLNGFKASTVSAVAIALLAAASIATSLILYPNIAGAFGAALAVIMIWIATVDARRFRIPNTAVLLAAALGLFYAGAGEFGSLPNMALALGRGAILAFMFAALRGVYKLIRGRDGLGFGDVKLAAAAGIWLDFDAAAMTIALASLSGLLFYSCQQYLAGRALLATNRVPFGLFFAPAIWLGWLFESRWFGTF